LNKLYIKKGGEDAFIIAGFKGLTKNTGQGTNFWRGCPAPEEDAVSKRPLILILSETGVKGKLI